MVRPLPCGNAKLSEAMRRVNRAKSLQPVAQKSPPCRREARHYPWRAFFFCRCIPTGSVLGSARYGQENRNPRIVSLGHHVCLAGAWRVDVLQEVATGLVRRAFYRRNAGRPFSFRA